MPGVGQLLRGRVADALLFLVLATWLHMILGGLAWGVRAGVVWDGLFLGALGFPPGTATPTVVVVTVLMVLVHVYAAWDAAKNLPPEGAGESADEPAA